MQPTGAPSSSEPFGMQTPKRYLNPIGIGRSPKIHRVTLCKISAENRAFRNALHGGPSGPGAE
eukprot:2780237-Pyramimonas_sp.AAC.1